MHRRVSIAVLSSTIAWEHALPSLPSVLQAAKGHHFHDIMDARRGAARAVLASLAHVAEAISCLVLLGARHLPITRATFHTGGWLVNISLQENIVWPYRMFCSDAGRGIARCLCHHTTR